MKNCNACKHINTTEKEEKQCNNKEHLCRKHNIRVFHRHDILQILRSYIQPCNRCYGDDFIKRRK